VVRVVNVLVALIQNRMMAHEAATFRYSMHLFLTPSPIPYPVVNAVEVALTKLCNYCLFGLTSLTRELGPC